MISDLNNNSNQEAPQWMRDMFEALKDMFEGLSSKATNTPGSPCWVAPRTRNSIARRVLPQPALSQTSVGLPRGKPSAVISSSPWMPEAALGKSRTATLRVELIR